MIFIRDIKTLIDKYGYVNLTYLYDYISDKYKEIMKNDIYNMK